MAIKLDDKKINCLASIKKIPPSLLVEVLEHHRDAVAKKSAELAPQLEQTKVELEKLVLANIGEQGLKLPLTAEVVRKRLARLRLLTADPAIVFGASGIFYGSHSPQTETIYISVDIDPKGLAHTLLHEMLHSFSGSSFSKSHHDADESAGHFNKTGLLFNTSSDYFFMWLNEAITEQLAVDLLGKDDVPSYHAERRLLGLLAGQAGTPERRLFEQAYFENYGEGRDAKQKHALPHTQKLFDFFNKKFGAGFLAWLADEINYQARALSKLNAPAMPQAAFDFALMEKAIDAVCDLLEDGSSAQELFKAWCKVKGYHNINQPKNK